MLDTYVAEAPKIWSFYRRAQRARYRTLSNLPGLTGHLHKMFMRSMEPEPIHRNVLGPKRAASATVTECIVFSIASR